MQNEHVENKATENITTSGHHCWHFTVEVYRFVSAEQWTSKYDQVCREMKLSCVSQVD